MIVSVIVPTYNGAKKIKGIIKALEQQTYSQFELIVVVDGSTDDTLSVLHSVKTKLQSFKIIEQENKGRSAVRNMGAQSTQADLLIFFDDDMLPLPDCVARHVKHHTEVQRSVLTGGMKEPVSINSTDILKYKSYLSSKWNLSLRTDGGLLSSDQIFITAANFSIRKEDFDRLKGFDENLNDAEDFDLALRAHKAGLALYFKEEIFGWHQDNLTCVSYIKRQRQYMAAHRKLSKLKPWIYEEKFRAPPYDPKGWRKRVYLFFCNKFWIDAVDKGILKILPKKLRYKTYDLIITANGILFPKKVSL